MRRLPRAAAGFVCTERLTPELAEERERLMARGLEDPVVAALREHAGHGGAAFLRSVGVDLL